MIVANALYSLMVRGGRRKTLHSGIDRIAMTCPLQSHSLSGLDFQENLGKTLFILQMRMEADFLQILQTLLHLAFQEFKAKAEYACIFILILKIRIRSNIC